MIPLKNELVGYSIRKIRTFPVVEMEFHPEANQVEYVVGWQCSGAIALHVSEKIQSCRTIGC
jgi:5-(carboxyamino)imidazole ribonucleotide synthase